MEKISLKELAKQVSNSKLIIAVCMLISFLFGFIVYKITPKEYASKVQILVISNDENPRQSQLGTLASLAGLNFNSTSVGVAAPSYEFILASSSFLLDIVGEKIEFEGDTIYIGDYLTQRMIVGWNQKVKNAFNKDLGSIKSNSVFLNNKALGTGKLSALNIPILNLDEQTGKSIRVLRNSIEFIYEVQKPISIVVKLQDPEVSAEVAKIVVEKLEEYIHQYTRENKQDNFSFLEKEVEKAKEELYQIQSNLAYAKDRNINVNRATAGMSIERLELRYSQARKNYTDLLTQLDNSKIQVENERALFIIIEPPLVLNKNYPTAPRGVIYILLTFFIGIFGSLAVVFFRSFLKRNNKS